jgi:hypothetical protein
LIKASAALILLIAVSQLAAKDNVRSGIILTNGLKGGFSSSPGDSEKNDPVVLLMQSVLNEKKKGAAAYFDLGSSFYPGVLSKYSYGAAMMDYFTFSGCDSTVISSDDLQVGTDNLEFLQKPGSPPLLSANILRDGSTVFKTHVIKKIGSKRVAFVGLSSKKTMFDAAEKSVYKISLDDPSAAMGRVLAQVKQEGADNIVVLCGLDFAAGFEVMKKYPEIGMMITGGDNSADLLNSRISRIDLDDGRSIISLSAHSGYYMLEAEFSDKINVISLTPRVSRPVDTRDADYLEFIDRIERWKTHFRVEAEKPLADTGERSFVLDSSRAGSLMRDKYNAEVAVVREGTVRPIIKTGVITKYDFYSSIDDNYSIFTFKVTGAHLKSLQGLSGYHISGVTDGRVQGRDIIDSRPYRVAATQPVYEAVSASLSAAPEYKNEWNNISGMVGDDLAGDGAILNSSFWYLERRFRGHIDIYLSYFRENSEVTKDDGIAVPPGRPAESYAKIGTENRIDFTIYNRYHRFIITPYIYYVRQDEQYLQNLFRGTLLYNLNLGYPVSPYNKLQMDTLLFEVDEMRPTVVRETLGAEIETKYLTGRLGGGFEKQIADPVEPHVYGFELILKFSYNFMKYYTYTLSMDSFASYNRFEKNPDEKGYLRTSIDNTFSINLTEQFLLNFRHKWFNYYYPVSKEEYAQSQFITSVSLKTDFKIW